MPHKRRGSASTEASSTAQKRSRHSSNVSIQHCPTEKLKEWINVRHIFLDELLHHDGKGEYADQDKCFSCKNETCYYKCKDCFHEHAHLPLHRIEMWNGLFFEKESLQNIGLNIQLGHGGADCSRTTDTNINIVVVDTTGVHNISVSFCDCKIQATPRYIQLLRAGWFPASIVWPQTVITFECLETFHELTLQAKTTLYDWYHTLCRKTDKCKLKDDINCYNEFRTRGGRGQFTEGITGTKNGELTVECPACPHPGKNLPDDWQNAELSKFLYIMYLAIDANFKLSCKERGIEDIELIPGWGPFVEETAYQTHLKDHIDNSENMMQFFRLEYALLQVIQ
ncbi:hypothetical protein BDQ17DRAFT_1394724 [Cyathus striatus]|nr:hypothetical protein BDQ17DRAFT_1394724 [Cyathus striatus]